MKIRPIDLLILIFIIIIAVVVVILNIYNRNTESQAISITEEPKVTTTWLGFPVHAIPNPKSNTDQPILLRVEYAVQLGLREDGTVIWKLLKQKAMPLEEELKDE